MEISHNNEISIIGVRRGSQYSPNHESNDAAIFNHVVIELEHKGYKIDIYHEKDFVNDNINGDLIFDMARDKITISRLQSLEDDGAIVINSAYGIENCSRRAMTELLVENGIPHPKSFVIDTNDKFDIESYPCWIKRGDSHAMVKNDVCFVENHDDARKVMDDFKARGISVAVVNEHLQGDLIKFYGVRGTDFFYWFYPSPCSHSKFGLEAINGVARGFSFDLDELIEYSTKASEILNVPIYGGDCVVSSNGDIKIIDFNDWPSFARCREEAGAKIAEFLLHKIEKLINGK